MHKNIEILIADDPDHEKVYAEIYFDSKFVALVSQEEGPGNEKIEMPGAGLDDKQITRNVNLKDFQNALHLAVKRLRGDSEDEDAFRTKNQRS